MNSLPYQSSKQVRIVSGAFESMFGVIVSHAEAITRWPNTPSLPEVERGEAFYVVLHMFGRDVLVIQTASQLAAG